LIEIVEKSGFLKIAAKSGSIAEAQCLIKMSQMIFRRKPNPRWKNSGGYRGFDNPFFL